ncbi:sugar phosphate isomerase/epimerase family protein [Opitutus terrae]|uniref:Xylose isomerase domain protein TIM barrel n=1 Tax=Opitutus terrae (strain DSM 11246 / JCM 15787 / PB90-1) TaxID=452637 RepID=B2A0A1_OPITP|nr:sugar phosphate isomerase/epimerase family protein [Opitutus terrae]ACB77437.1 Xylose isomerase domain protein TIM barrel [Opitutus terrae PB90-1]
MNHPGEPLARELAWMAELKLDFIDLTLEPPAAATWSLQPAEVSRMLRDHGLGVVGHTAFYLPIASSFESLRRAALDELKRAAEFFAKIGAKWMNVHPDGHAPFIDEPTIVLRNVSTLRELVEFAAPLGVGIMLENVPGRFNTVPQLTPILDAIPQLGLHLDIGHCNLGLERSSAPEMIAHFRRRIAHVHVHDNRGGHADLHLAIGMGQIDLAQHLRELRRSGYDQTITLEVFAPDRHFLGYSRDRLREMWNAAATAA